jgi:hypothetical protein
MGERPMTDQVTQTLKERKASEVIQNAVEINAQTSLSGTLRGFELKFNLKQGEAATIYTRYGTVEYQGEGNNVTRDIKASEEAHDTTEQIHQRLRERWKQ